MSRLPGQHPIDATVPEARTGSAMKELERRIEIAEARARPSFVRLSGGGNVVGGGSPSLISMTTALNSGAWYLTTSNTRLFTSLPGIYYIDLHMSTGNSSADTVSVTQLKLNGSIILETRDWVNEAGGYVAASSGCLFALDADDYLEAFAFHDDGTTTRVFDVRFSAFRVGDV